MARSTGTRPLAPPALPHPPLRPPAGLQSGSKGEAERTCWPRDVPAQPRSRGSRSSFPPRLHSPCPHPAADPLPPARSAPPRRDPGLQLPGATPPLGGVDPASALQSSGVGASSDRFLTRVGGGLLVLTFTDFVDASLTPTSAPRYRLTRPASGPAWAGARLRMPFPLQAQSAARATGSVGGRAGDVGRVGPGGAANSGRGLLLLARPQPPLSGRDFRCVSWWGELPVQARGLTSAVPRVYQNEHELEPVGWPSRGSLVSVRAELGSVLPGAEG